MFSFPKHSRLKTALTALCLAPLLMQPTVSSSAENSPGSINRTDSWGGEWPRGFTVQRDTSVDMHSTADPFEDPSLTCDMTKGATYHPWNHDRIKTDSLQFLTIETILPYVVTKTGVLFLTREHDEKEMQVTVTKGDQWNFLTYYGEGFFRMSLNGEVYTAEQGALDQSEEIVSEDDSDPRFEEWLQLTCANGARGWLMLEELGNLDELEQGADFGPANMTEYGQAKDL